MLKSFKLKERAVALLIVTMMIALLSTLVMQITNSTFLQSRSLGMLERNVQAEYLLKSAVNIAAAMIQQDTTPNYDSYASDTWGMFRSGAPVPSEMLAQLGINFLGLQLSIEIIPENAKMKLVDTFLTDNGSAASQAVTARAQYQLRTLFERLGFDDQLLQEDHTGLSNTRYTSAQLVSNIIDYLDQDTISFTASITLPDGSQLPNGIESDLPKDYYPKTVDIANLRMQELLVIPGMTPDRLQALMPHSRVRGRDDVNINVASSLVLQSLRREINSDVAEQIITYRDENQGFKNISEIDNVTTLIADKGGLTVDSPRFEFIAKVRFGDTKAQYLKAVIDNKSPTEPPLIEEVTYY
jgi:general secretion pathway protein K